LIFTCKKDCTVSSPEDEGLNAYPDVWGTPEKLSHREVVLAEFYEFNAHPDAKP
jgi:hypothetical protein